MTETFRYHDHELDYCGAPYNSSRLNERAVEIPIAEAFVDELDELGPGLEIGNVLSHYRGIRHRVVDRYEVADGVENLDVFELEGSFGWIVAISTLEHVRWDEEPKLPDGGLRAIVHLAGLLRPGGRMLATIPFGWNPFLDSAILDGLLGHELELAGASIDAEATLVRNGPLEWIQTAELDHRRYAASSIWAESVYVLEVAR